MIYIPRRIQVYDDKDNSKIYSDSDFFQLNGPLVLLGEPGAGKTRLLDTFGKQTNSPIYIASAVPLHPIINEVAAPQKIIFDGIDEVTTYTMGSTTANSILSKISTHSEPNFILACRTADWQQSISIRDIQNRWHQKPTIGHLLPFDDNEIKQFIEANECGIDVDNFLYKAQQENIVELLRNPQNLLLFLKSIKKSGGWPTSKHDLYENACKTLLQEQNEYHASKQSLPDINLLIETAGFICAQLLLSGNIGISIDNQKIPSAVKIDELIYDNDSISISRYIISTMLFRLNTNNVLMPCHRTVAEFLAAKWLSKNLRKKLSLSRLENILYGNDHIVPPALRGLHAWLATFSQNERKLFIERDPYGFLKYGDPSFLTIEQSKTLLKSLQKVADEDPYFRGVDWHVGIGKGFLKPELQEDVLNILRSPNPPLHLSYLIVQLIAQTKSNKFLNGIKESLIEILLDKSFSLVERIEIIAALRNCSTQPNWLSLFTQLKSFGDIDSLELIIEVFKCDIKQFKASQISDAILKIINGSSEGSTSYISLGYKLFEELSNNQIEGCLQAFQKKLHEEGAEKRELHQVQELITQLIQERLKREPLPNPKLLWSWLILLEQDYQRTQKDNYINDYLMSNEYYRRQIQTAALETTSTPDQLWLILCSSHTWLWINEDDIIYHLNGILISEIANKELKWKELVRWTFLYQPFTGLAFKYAKKQSVGNQTLKMHLNDIKARLKENKKELCKFEKENRRRIKAQKEEVKKRHSQYAELTDQILSGTHLNALAKVAKAYLGWFSNIEGTEPLDRVADLVGLELAPLALNGIITAVECNSIPSPEDLIALRINKSLISPFEHILIVYCDILLSRNQTFNKIPLNIAQSALTSFQWGSLYKAKEIEPCIQEKLESIVFHNSSAKESFISQTIEPYLQSSETYIPGLYRIKNDSFFNDISGKVATKWLRKYPNLERNILREILIIAICHARQDALDIISERVNDPNLDEYSHQDIWLSAGFLIDDKNLIPRIEEYVSSDKETIWRLSKFMHVDKQISEFWPKLNEYQLYFFILHYGPKWPYTPFPTGSWGGSEHPWDACRLIKNCIREISLITKPEAKDYISKLIECKNLESYQDELRHALAQNKRKLAGDTKHFSLREVRSVLLNDEPADQTDLQSLLLDQLSLFQNRLKNSETNDYQSYWDGDTPHVENYCRDRIISALNPFLERYNVSAGKEGARSEETRCDILFKHNLIDLPLEVKGQWNKDLWTAASKQLEGYASDYHSEGYGIYLVLWFGDTSLPNKAPMAWKGKRPKSFEEISMWLSDCYQGISEKIKIFVLDLSKKI